MRFFAFALVAALILSAVAVARAQDAEMDTIVVEGRILRPQAAYIIQRASIEFGIEAKKRSFVGKVVESVNKEPFLP
ncbi:hypothetical protein K8I61_16450 [bacterium]|nr:hypothetical protein [bacterium]